MENKYTSESLKEAIKELEIKQAEEGENLKEQLMYTYESLKPANFLKNLVKDIYSTESLKDELINTAVSVASGLVSKKLVVRRSNNEVLKLLGLAVQFGISTFVSKKMDVLKEAAINFMNRFIEKKEQNEDIN